MRTYFVLLLISALISCTPKEQADLIITNGSIYTANDASPNAEAVVIKDGKIIYVGDKFGVQKYDGELLDLNGKTMLPGLHEGHAHLMGVGFNLLNVDLMEAQTYAEVVEMVKERAANTPEGQWIIGRGWHQDKWIDQPEHMFKNLPTHYDLSEAVPDHPVFLSHASGHMGLTNAKAMELVGIDANTPQPNGGEIFIDLGGPTGIFNETAQGLVRRVIPSSTLETRTQALTLAIEECVKNGITTFHNAGSSQSDIDLYKDFAGTNKLKIRLYNMLSGRDSALIASYFQNGLEIGLYDNHLTTRSVKLYGDGALGSRGAWLLNEYSDAPGAFGHEVTPMEMVEEVTKRAYDAGFQVGIHAIGDRANQEALDIYERTFESGTQEDPRFRIEHAQHIHPDDIPRFGELGVIPAMQAIHMSSDRPWAIDRLGKERIENGAYMWQELLQTGARIVNGTDAPVEPIDILASFYSSVSRRTLKGSPEGGYEPTQKMTREQALKSLTLDAAYGAFMEDIVGSIRVGKKADFTILDKDIMTIPEDDIQSAQVSMTIIDGKIVYQSNH
ncbi:MAG: amidohydrolase [Cytophagales bacterium]|nr:amidohydrolase [Cytophagales bacterium]